MCCQDFEVEDYGVPVFTDMRPAQGPAGFSVWLRTGSFFSPTNRSFGPKGYLLVCGPSNKASGSKKYSPQIVWCVKSLVRNPLSMFRSRKRVTPKEGSLSPPNRSLDNWGIPFKNSGVIGIAAVQINMEPNEV